MLCNCGTNNNVFNILRFWNQKVKFLKQTENVNCAKYSKILKVTYVRKNEEEIVIQVQFKHTMCNKPEKHAICGENVQSGNPSFSSLLQSRNLTQKEILCIQKL